MENKQVEQKYMSMIVIMTVTVLTASIMVSCIALTVKFITWLF